MFYGQVVLLIIYPSIIQIPFYSSAYFFHIFYNPYALSDS